MNPALQYLPSSARDASRLGVPMHEIKAHRFPNGELRVTVGAAAPTILHILLDRPNDKVIALLFTAEALRRDGAKRLVLVAPNLCAATIDVIVTHALFPAALAADFSRAGSRSIRSTNSVPHPTNRIALDGILATALRAELGDAATPDNN